LSKKAVWSIKDEIMKKPFIIGVLVFIGLLAAGYGLVVSDLSGPKLQGKRVITWMDDLASREIPVRDKAKQTIQANAKDFLPVLVAMMKAQDSEQRQKWATVLNVEYPPSYTLRLGAVRGFTVLGAAAAPVIPELLPLLAVQDAGLDVAAAFGAIGKDAVTPLVQKLADPDKQVRAMAAASLSRMKPGEAAGASDALLKGLQDADGTVRSWVATAVGKSQVKAELAIPILITMLEDKETSVVAAAATALGLYGPASKEALPKLEKLAKSRNEEVSGSAQNALFQINPEPAAEAKKANE
jgi:HEAT repeat protein